MKPKWLNKEEPHRIKSDKRVAKIAKKMGGKPVANSGATNWKKGDIRFADTLLEHKMTGKKSFKLNKEMLEKHYNDATKEGKDGMVMIDFGDIYLIGWIGKSPLKQVFGRG